MSIKFILESGIEERRDLRSGRIYQEGSSPEYGVIFTWNEDKSENDLDLDPALLPGAYIGDKDAPEGEKDRFFEILGGYFYHDNYPDAGTTTKVFGIALDPEFGVTEGGTTTLDDKWKLQDPEKPILDESYWSEKFGKHHGWTFIVTLKEREKYPTSDQKLKIFAYCSAIKDIAVEVGDCEYDSEGILKRRVTFITSTGDTEPKKWTWDFGDGSTESDYGVPPDSIDHFYEDNPDNAPQLCLQSHIACGKICKEATLPEFEKCPRCPEIKDIDVSFGACITEGEKRRRKVTFTVSIEGDDPVSWSVDFGDGSSDSGDRKPPSTIEHLYEKMPETLPKICVIGPNPCKEVCKEVDMSGFEECLPCPTIEKIEHEILDNTENTKTVEISVIINGRKPDEIIWDWGDGSPEETTTELQASHVYKMLPDEPGRYTLTVTIIGPKDCRDSAEIVIDIPPLICSVIEHIEVVYGDCISDGEVRRRKVIFKASISGSEPTSWTWEFGDGTTESGVGKPPVEIEHYYDQKPSHAPKLCIVGPSPCKESCMEADISEFEICPSCPQIKDIEYEIFDKDEFTKTVRFKAIVVDGTPDQYEWDFGDGSPTETTTVLETSHDYEMLRSGPAEYKVTVTATGPEDCHDSADTTIKIPPYTNCPKFKDIEAIIGDCEEVNGIRGRNVEFIVTVEGDDPDKWIIYYGDGSNDSGQGNPSAPIKHLYLQKPEKPVQICLIGPDLCEDACREIDMSEFDDCPTCPQIREIDYTIVDKDEFTKTVNFKAIVIDGVPDKYEWVWGDDSPLETTTGPEASHDYEMLPDEQGEYNVIVTTIGPEDCQDSTDTKIEIPPIECPAIEDINVTIEECVTEGEIRRRKVTFTALIKGREADSWSWDFGDGTTKSGNGCPPKTIEHSYEKMPNDAPKLCIVGPGPCKETCKESDMSEFKECLPCPQITGLKHRSVKRDENFEMFELNAEVDKKPEKFEWEFGDGSKKEETTETIVTHRYKISAAEKTYGVKLTASGPEDCWSSIKDKITIKPHHVVPKFCFLLALVVAFLMASTFGTYVAYCAADIFDLVQDTLWLVQIIVILAILSGIAIFVWYRITRKTLCPIPNKCDWMGIGWIVILASMLVAFYVRNCCAPWWMAVVVILFIIAAFLYILWGTKCVVKIIEMILYFIVCILAATFVCFMIVNDFFSCLR